MEKFSLTYAGVLAMIIGPVLVQQTGLSEACGNEVATFISTLPGTLMALWGRYRAGGVNALGFKK